MLVVTLTKKNAIVFKQDGKIIARIWKAEPKNKNEKRRVAIEARDDIEIERETH